MMFLCTLLLFWTLSSVSADLVRNSATGSGGGSSANNKWLHEVDMLVRMQSRLGACQGKCYEDDDCSQGMMCFHRSGYERVPGCKGEGEWGRNYCFAVNNTQPDFSAKTIDIGGPGTGGDDGFYTYRPGQFTVRQHGLLLSQGLLARVIAQEGRPVRFDTGGRSEIPFHGDPDGAAIFSRNGTDGFVYVSNSEKTRGGVGAIHFNSKGQVIDYRMILTGTKDNCGGGKTWWNTWLTCEEHENGLVWEVDPWGEWSQRTIVSNVRANYESAAFDNRNPKDPKFFVSIDEDDGPLLRFTPATNAVNRALETGDYTSLLSTRGQGAKWEYLVLDYQTNLKGTFKWTTNMYNGRRSAYRYFRGLEGVDVHEGMLYMTAKQDKLLFILDLDKMTFVETSTETGAFDGQPDQVYRLLDGNDDGSILYFCEDGSDGSGIHGRDTSGNFFSILQADEDSRRNGGLYMSGETTGLAFSPDNKFMYVTYQEMGTLLELRRIDGLPFNGKRLDIKYHQDHKLNLNW